MKTITIIIISLFCANIIAQDIQEQEIKTNVNEATVFLDGAQVLRKKKVQLSPGKKVLKLVIGRLLLRTINLRPSTLQYLTKHLFQP